LGSVRSKPYQGGVAVLNPGWIRVLGSEAIVDREHDATGIGGQSLAAQVLGLKIAEDERPTVVVGDTRRGTMGASAPIDPHWKPRLPSGPGDRPFTDLEPLVVGRQLSSHLGLEPHSTTGGANVHIVVEVSTGHLLHHGSDFGIDGHRVTPFCGR
jgi:hypothetical protein